MPFDLKVSMFFARLFSRKGNKPCAVELREDDYIYHTQTDLLETTRMPKPEVYEAIKQFDGRLWIDGEGWKHYAILPSDNLADQFKMMVALL